MTRRIVMAAIVTAMVAAMGMTAGAGTAHTGAAASIQHIRYEPSAIACSFKGSVAYLSGGCVSHDMCGLVIYRASGSGTCVGMDNDTGGTTRKLDKAATFVLNADMLDPALPIPLNGCVGQSHLSGTLSIGFGGSTISFGVNSIFDYPGAAGEVPLSLVGDVDGFVPPSTGVGLLTDALLGKCYRSNQVALTVEGVWATYDPVQAVIDEVTQVEQTVCAQDPSTCAQLNTLLAAAVQQAGEVLQAVCSHPNPICQTSDRRRVLQPDRGRSSWTAT